MTESRKKGDTLDKLWREVFADDLALEPSKVQTEATFDDGERITIEGLIVPDTSYMIRWDDEVHLWSVLNFNKSIHYGLFDTFERAKYYALNMSYMTVSETPGGLTFPQPAEEMHMLSIALEFEMREYNHPRERIRLTQ